MGDRANVVLRDTWPDDLHHSEAVFLYSHWQGWDLPEILRQALDRGRQRWGDDQYMARIVFNEMTRDNAPGLTGFGISTRLTDNEYDLLVLHKGYVYRLPENQYRQHGFRTLEQFPHISFQDYVAVQPRTWENLTVPPMVAA